ncbi:hypothetical protein FV222_19165 [Methylobacterium sp. WL103]|nr:hypothetical protein FV226_19400 [Methylobacterium sp. WL12]TXM96073.1 hypothetical protein FV222_19165 [Methylobacterium sp. WL103]
MQRSASLATGWLHFPALKPIKLYWEAYGGWSEFLKSIYLWLAFAFTVVTYPVWIKLDNDGNRVWASMPTSILPNLLGFSMGGMAIMLAFAGSKIFTYLSEEGKKQSYFVKIVASFYHFILVQTLAIFMGIFCQAYAWVGFNFLGYWAMCYALLVAPATAAQLFNTARIVNTAASIGKNDAE